MKPIIKVENLSKQYRLGTIGTGTLRNDFTRWLHRLQGKEDPFLKIGEANDRSTKASSEYVWALVDINFEVMPGEVLGIIGKNGAGKSTLLKILSKVTGPTTGRIDYNGRIGSLLEVGTGFHPELTGRENIFLNGAILGMTKAEIRSKLDEIIDFSGCERYIDTPVKRYSSGMTVRLGFAVAAHLEPEILVVDEVLAVGDAEFQKKAIGKMQDVSRNEGRTVLFVSHNMSSVRSICDNGIVLANGGQIFEGSIDRAIENYLEESVRNNNKEIIGNAKYFTSKIRLDRLLVNGKSTNKVLLDNIKNEILFLIEGEVYNKMSVAIGVMIYDNKENPLAFFSPTHKDGITTEFDIGKFRLEKKLKLPTGISEGKYLADIFITNPLKETYIELTKSLQIESEGFITKGGLSFNYNQGHGWLLFS